MSARIDYWLEGEVEVEVLLADCYKVPELGEVIHIDTLGDKEWHLSQFKTDRFFNEGLSGNFEVTSVKRFIRTFDVIVEEKTEKGTFKLPSKKVVETFEVFLKPYSQRSLW